MAPGPRAYSAGTKAALFALANGTCYFPDCEQRVVVFVEGHPVNNVHIAHIRGAEPGSARYDPTMTDDDRRAFANLVLLCKPHHTLVDDVVPDDYPPEVLMGWKRTHEGLDTKQLDELSGDSIEVLEAYLRSVVSEMAPARLVTIELLLAIRFPGERWVSTPPSGAKLLVAANPNTVEEVAVLGVVRNVGALDAFVDSCTLVLPVVTPDAVEAPIAWLGRNDYPAHNPSLPCRLRSGESMKWLSGTAAIWEARAAVTEGFFLDTFALEAHLGSGETLCSARVAIDLLPWHDGNAAK
jgi:hypothetical protein